MNSSPAQLPSANASCGLVVEPALVNGSGAFDVTSDEPGWRASVEHAKHLGAYVTKTVTLEQRQGRPMPRIAPWPHGGLVNAVGIPSPGIQAALRDWSATLGSIGRPIILSVFGTPDEVGVLIDVAEDVDWIAGVELNLSCPNVPGTGSIDVVGTVAAARARTIRPVWAKLGPDVDRIAERAIEARDAGADAIVAVNTLRVRAIDTNGAQLLGSEYGGVSGQPIHELALRCVSAVSAAIDTPVVGIGGVDSTKAASRMLDAGASIVGVGTVACRRPNVLRELATHLARSR